MSIKITSIIDAMARQKSVKTVSQELRREMTLMRISNNMSHLLQLINSLDIDKFDGEDERRDFNLVNPDLIGFQLF